MKMCSKCHVFHPIECFNRDKQKRDGLTSHCKLCIKKNAANWCKNNKEKIKVVGKKRYLDNKKYHQEFMKQWYLDNKEYALKKSKEWKDNNKARRRQYHIDYFSLHKEERKEYILQWTVQNPEKIAFYKAKRRSVELKAMPNWLTVDQVKEIEEIYQIAKDLQWLSEEPLEVDHIVPLQGKNVCGLHVPWNLQILPRNLNRIKGNSCP